MSTEEYVVEAPDLAGRITVRPPALFGSAQLWVDGSPARPGPRPKTFLVTGTDGSEQVANWAPDFLAVVPQLVVNGRKYTVGPKIPIALLIAAALPFVLVPLGGLLGGACGGLAFAINQQIARSALPVWLRALLILGVGGAAFVTFLVVVTVLHVVLGP